MASDHFRRINYWIIRLSNFVIKYSSISIYANISTNNKEIDAIFLGGSFFEFYIYLIQLEYEK